MDLRLSVLNWKVFIDLEMGVTPFFKSVNLAYLEHLWFCLGVTSSILRYFLASGTTYWRRLYSLTNSDDSFRFKMGGLLTLIESENWLLLSISSYIFRLLYLLRLTILTPFLALSLFLFEWSSKCLRRDSRKVLVLLGPL